MLSSYLLQKLFTWPPPTNEQTSGRSANTAVSANPVSISPQFSGPVTMHFWKIIEYVQIDLSLSTLGHNASDGWHPYQILTVWLIKSNVFNHYDQFHFTTDLWRGLLRRGRGVPERAGREPSGVAIRPHSGKQTPISLNLNFSNSLHNLTISL